MKKEKKQNFKIIGIFFLLALTFFVYTQSQVREQEEEMEVLLPVMVMKPLFGNLEKRYSVNGYLESDDIVTVLPKVSGTLEELKPQVGDFVSKDSPIARVDDKQMTLTLSQAETAYNSSKDTYERQKLLFENNATSKQNYEQSKAAYDANKSQYELARLQLSYSQIKAPISGTVLQIQANEGAFVSPGVPILVLGTLDNLVMKVNIPEKFYEYFFLEVMGGELTRPDYPYKKYNAGIRYISPVIDPKTMTFQVVCYFTESVELLRPGMFMKATFILDSVEDIYFLPVESVQNSKAWYIDLETNQAYKIDIPNAFENDEYIEIPEELKDYTFIKEGFYFLKEGQKVNILEVKK